MHLQLQKQFRCSAAQVWLHLCDPTRMSSWSGFAITAIAPGQGGHPGGPGAHRRVFLPFAGRVVVLNEVIRDARPPHRLTYQVVDTAAMRSHMGQIYLEDTPSGCVLRWEVEFELIVPAANTRVALALKIQLGTALDRLVASLDGATDDAIELPSWPDIPAPDAQDWTRAEATLSHLRALASELDGQDDPKRIFAHIYSFVSEGILNGCRDGRFIYPVWALRLLPVFHEYYWRNLRCWQGQEEGPVESHWRRAFAAAEKPKRKKTNPIAMGLVLAIHAHVESDLPRTLAQVYVDHFAESADYDRFRGDYYAMGTIFMDSARRITALIPQDSVPLWARALGRFMPQEVTQQVIYRKAYNLPKERRAAFRRGAELASMLLERQASASQPP